jgi:hypothetical protein
MRTEIMEQLELNEPTHGGMSWKEIVIECFGFEKLVYLKMVRTHRKMMRIWEESKL